MASLQAIIKSKNSAVEVAETNLERGEIYFFTPGGQRSSDHVQSKNVVWTAPQNGTAVIEVWGASGSVGKMCCCGWAMPGNPGAYAKKTIEVGTNDTVCMILGDSCANDQLCHKGISEATCVCWTTQSATGAIVAGGGRGGPHICVSGGSSYCCGIAYGFPGQTFSNIGGSYSGGSAGCGLLCNYFAGEIAQATGGDINKDGGFSCVLISHCNPCCQCHFVSAVRVAPGLVSQEGATMLLTHNCGPSVAQVSGAGAESLYMGLSGLSRTPTQGNAFTTCWTSGKPCSCYETWTRYQYNYPHGVPAPTEFPCSSVRNWGHRGGPGAVRIQFIGT